jgi:ABC-type bacteriocin/lantibiotic exporter with double-glycine peptidase domain
MAGAKRIYVLLKDYEARKPDGSENLAKPDITGRIQFKEVDFNYPTRPEASVGLADDARILVGLLM